MFAKRKVIIFVLSCFQFLGHTKPVESSAAVETFCEDLCPIKRGYFVPSPEEEEICEKLCFIRVEVGDFGRRISIFESENNSTENVVLSPFSIVSLLNLIMMATSGNANKEIKGAVSYSEDLDENYIHQNYKKFLNILHGKNRGVELHFHTALFFQEGVTILDSFNKTAVTSYLGKIDYLNFQNSPDTAKESINTWVSEKTEGRIKEIISTPFSPDTKCIGVSFTTFKSSWAFGFNSSLTENGNFFTGSKDIVIPIMTTKMNALYFKNEIMGFEIISLPFLMNSYAMYILQPINTTGVNELQRIENSLDPGMLNSTLIQMKPKFMKVTIPRMKLELKLSLKEDLKSFGANQVFSQGADFGRMSSDPGIIINDLFHVGILEVNEAGINTDIISDEFVSTSEGSFHLNKPSLVMIRDKENEFIIFWGKVIDPQPLK